MKFLLPLLRNNILQLSHANQLRYADTKNRTKTITLYMLIAAILMGLLAYLIYSLKIIYSIAWSLEEVVTQYACTPNSAAYIDTLQIDCPVYGRSRPYCGAAASYDGAVWPDRRYGISVLSNCAWNNNHLSCHSRSFGNNDRNTDLPHLEKFLCSYRLTKGSGGYSGFVCIYDLYVLQIP